MVGGSARARCGRILLGFVKYSPCSALLVYIIEYLASKPTVHRSGTMSSLRFPLNSEKIKSTRLCSFGTIHDQTSICNLFTYVLSEFYNPCYFGAKSQERANDIIQALGSFCLDR